MGKVHRLDAVKLQIRGGIKPGRVVANLHIEGVESDLFVMEINKSFVDTHPELFEQFKALASACMAKLVESTGAKVHSVHESPPESK
jgi:hypothetical protein